MPSLPVPVSPAIRAVIFVGATASTKERMPRRHPRRPTIVSTNGSSSRFSLRARSSSLQYATTFIGIFPASSLICITELEAELIFTPMFAPSLPAKSNRFCSYLWLRTLARFSFQPLSLDPLSDVKAAVVQLDRVGFPFLQEFNGLPIYPPQIFTAQADSRAFCFAPNHILHLGHVFPY